MYNTRNPTEPSINDAVALQDDWEPDSEPDQHAAMDLRRNPAHTSTGNRIEFFSLGGSSPHYLRGIRVGHTTLEPRSNPNVLPLSESPCLSPPAPRKV